MPPKKQKVVFVCFTFARDAGCALALADFIARYPEHTLVLVDDASNPFGAEYHARTNALPSNVQYVNSEFNRNKNLNGAPAVYGVLETMRMFGEFYKAEWVVKIDSDTIPTPALFETFQTTDKNVVTTLTAVPNNIPVFMCGAMYGIRLKVLHRIERLFDGLMARFDGDAEKVHNYLDLGHCTRRLPEDQTMQQLVRCMEEPMDMQPLGWYDHGRKKLWAWASRSVSFGCYETLERPSPEEIEAQMRLYTDSIVS